MGRAGRGISSNSSRSSGSRSMSRSSGGHRVGSSSQRAGRGSGSFYNNTPSFNHSRPSYHTHYNSSGRRSYNYGSYRSSGSGFSGAIISIIVVGIIIVAAIFAIRNISGNSVPASTQNREKLTNSSYNNNCIVDEMNWIENKSQLSKKLQYFFDKTGVQPYIYLKAYDSSLVTDEQKTAYAEKYYEDNISNEYTFLFVYFGEKNESTVGYMNYVNGYAVSSVMDAEAIDIFWAYIDKYWYNDISTVDVFDNVFRSTADRIMTHTTTSKDVAMVIVIIIGVVVVAIIVGLFVKMKRKHDKARAEETAAILNAPIDQLANGDNDELLNKYSDKNS